MLRYLALSIFCGVLMAGEASLLQRLADADTLRGDARMALRREVEALPMHERKRILDAALTAHPDLWSLMAWAVRDQLADANEPATKIDARQTTRQQWDLALQGAIPWVREVAAEITPEDASAALVRLVSVDDRVLWGKWKAFDPRMSLTDPLTNVHQDALAGRPEIALAVLLDLATHPAMQQADFVRRFWWTMIVFCRIPLSGEDLDGASGRHIADERWIGTNTTSYAAAQAIRMSAMRTHEDPCVVMSLAMMSDDEAGRSALLRFDHQKGWPGAIGGLIAYGRMMAGGAHHVGHDKHFHGAQLDQWLHALNHEQVAAVQAFLLRGFAAPPEYDNENQILPRPRPFYFGLSQEITVPVLRALQDQIMPGFRTMVEKYIQTETKGIEIYLSNNKAWSSLKMWPRECIPFVSRDETLKALEKYTGNDEAAAAAAIFIPWAKNVLERRDGPYPDGAFMEKAYMELTKFLTE